MNTSPHAANDDDKAHLISNAKAAVTKQIETLSTQPTPMLPPKPLDTWSLSMPHAKPLGLGVSRLSTCTQAILMMPRGIFSPLY